MDGASRMTAIAAWELPATIAAVLVALATIGKAAHWVYGWANRVDESLEYVRNELSFNGGSTTRDAVKRIDGRLDRIESNQATVAAELQEFRGQAAKANSVVSDGVSTLLDHDAKRDIEGKRYKTDEGTE